MTKFGKTRVQPKVQAYEGMPVKKLQSVGSDGQKLMAPIFDVNKNGKFDGDEVDTFNHCTFKTEPGKVTIFDRGAGPTTMITEIKYGKDGITGSYGEFNDNYDSFGMQFSDKKHHREIAIMGLDTAFKSVKIDLTKGEASFSQLDRTKVETKNINITE